MHPNHSIFMLFWCVLGMGISAMAMATVAAEPRRMVYRPEGKDFVVTNGTALFNRSIYCGNRGLRFEAGDRPEFALWLPGRGGNIRLALCSESQTLWLQDAAQVVARYRPGRMIYEITDPSLGAQSVSLVAIPRAQGDGLLLKLELRNPKSGMRLFVAYGGANEERGRRNGDLNAEREPLDRFFQLKPNSCQDNVFTISDNLFSLKGKTRSIEGTASVVINWSVLDATNWPNAAELAKSSGYSGNTPVVGGMTGPLTSEAVFISLRAEDANQAASNVASDLKEQFAEAQRRQDALMGRLNVETPDPFINAAAGAIAVAGDAIWDSQTETFMHGAVGWRVKLLGWRGMYAGDALGWHDRTRKHIDHFAAQQIDSPVPDALSPADEEFNLARNESSLRTNGYMAGRDTLGHYDMNLVAIDAFFRHLRWTGDLEYARKMWPTLTRHLAWERRLFRRTFGAEQLPLYEGYACIWASDELIYHGGGAAHASAYNYWHNRMAAQVAALIGEDPAPYTQEADLIKMGMQEELWLQGSGWLGEFKDLLGKKRVHPAAAAWSFYHPMDGDCLSSQQAWQMARYAETNLPRVPLAGAGVPEGAYTQATTNWMPYMWSTNNVVLAEASHLALAYWQAGKHDAAVSLFRGCLLDSMFMGKCPGNVGMSTQADANSGERYRDFADGVGIAARAVVEGLFGIQPDLLSGRITIRPGFPASWSHASLDHPNLLFRFHRTGTQDKFRIENRTERPVEVVLQVPAVLDRVASVQINGKDANWTVVKESVCQALLEIRIPPTPSAEVTIGWAGQSLETPSAPKTVASGENLTIRTTRAKLVELSDPQGVIRNAELKSQELAGSAGGLRGERTFFLHLSQGDLQWWQPVEVEVLPRWELKPADDQDPASLRVVLENPAAEAFKGALTVSVDGKDQVCQVDIPAGARQTLNLSADGLAPGSHCVAARMPDGSQLETIATNWRLPPAAHSPRWSPVDLDNVFNDKVSQIFRNEYRSPRSPYCSLGVPKQGIGGWCRYKDTAEIDDSGLRQAAAGKGSIDVLGIPFRTPSLQQSKNTLFVSLWDNYPDEATVPLNGRASRVCLLMAGTTNPMQSRIDNAEVVVEYADGSSDRLALRNPENWWPIEQDYFIDAFAFSRPGVVPPRLDLKTGKLRLLSYQDCESKNKLIAGGSANVLDLPLDSRKDLKQLTVRALSNEVVIGVLAVTLQRD